MADAIISSVVQQLTSLMDQELREEVRLVVGVEREVSRLKRNFEDIRAVLVDAEERQLKEQLVRGWLEKLKDESYNMEDVLDEWNTARMKLKYEREEINNALAPKKMVCCSFLLSPCFGFKQVLLRHDIAQKIKQINENLDGIAKAKDRFEFTYVRSSEKSVRDSISLIDESEIQGRDSEKDILKSKLLCGSSEENSGVQIISMVGMGGIGKTTLARLVYNDYEVERSFEKRPWVCVSDPFDEFRIARAIVEALRGSAASNVGETLQSLTQYIHASLAKMKFFLVLDDVWTEDYSKWEPFCLCLKNGLPGSKILVTTRKETVAQMMKSDVIIPIKVLSDKKCWLLFKHFAFFRRPPSSEDEKLEEIGKQIVGKCKGLPLAAKTIGSLLRTENREVWENILNSELWKLEELEEPVFAPLLLSYNDLNFKIKPCFLYCAVFLKDHYIKKDDLIKLWMAQGYLEGERDNEMEITGEKYFNDLASRSFFQEFQKDGHGNVKVCKMHDIVYDFAQFLRKNECFSIEISDPQESLINSNVIDKVRHLMLVLKRSVSLPVSIVDARRLRSLFIFLGGLETYPLIKENVFNVLTCLRALTIARYEWWGQANIVDEIPNGIKNLIHLRYLNLSYLCIKELPECCCELYNLQTLEINNCYQLRRLPQGIGKLVSLRYLKLSYLTIIELPESCCELYNLQTLEIQHCDELRSLPQGIGKLISLRHLIIDYFIVPVPLPKEIGRLTGLRTLSDFVVSDGGQGNLECLKHLIYLRGNLRIRGLGNVTDVDEAKKAELEKKKNLSYLNLYFDKKEEGTTEQTNEEIEVIVEVDHEAILEALRPNPNIERLDISYYKGKILFPNWLMTLTNLKYLSLSACINCENMLPLGKLSSLEEISIDGMSRVKRVGAEFLGTESDGTTSSSSSSLVITFPKLRRLEFRHMDEWEEWDFGIPSSGKEIRIMPNLNYLEILNCFKLKSLPDQILRNEKLETLCINLCPILESRFQEETGEDRHKIAHIPNLLSVAMMDESEYEE